VFCTRLSASSITSKHTGGKAQDKGECRLAVQLKQLKPGGHHTILQSDLVHSLLPPACSLHMFNGATQPFNCSAQLENGRQCNISHALLLAMVCCEALHTIAATAVTVLQRIGAAAVVPVVAQQLELTLVHAYLMQATHPQCVQYTTACLSDLQLETALATVVITARKGEVSELSEWSGIAGHPLLLWAMAVHGITQGTTAIANHVMLAKARLLQQHTARGEDTPSAAQHAAAAVALQQTAATPASRASLAAFAATQCLMLVQELFLMRAGGEDMALTDDLSAVSIPWVAVPSEPEVADTLRCASDLTQALLVQMGPPHARDSHDETAGAEQSAEAKMGDRAFAVMQLVVACTTRTGVEVQRLLQVLEPILPRAARAVLGNATNADEIDAEAMEALHSNTRCLLSSVAALRGLQGQVRAFTARMLRSRDSIVG
jgi:hypothetical protein